MKKFMILYQDCRAANQWGKEEFDTLKEAEIEFNKYWANDPTAVIIEYQVVRRGI